jgi:aconitate hydratase
MLTPPPPPGATVELVKGPNIASLPHFDPLPDHLTLPVLIKVGDDISTDEIMPAGSKVLPFRSNIPAISRFVFAQIDQSYYDRAMQFQATGSAIVGGANYGQGSSREHAALAPRYLGVRVVIAKSFARIHWQNLVNFGILPLTFVEPEDYDRIGQGDELEFRDLRRVVRTSSELEVLNTTQSEHYTLRHDLSERQLEMVLAGSLITVTRARAVG